jgi:hypothetical protein
MIAWIGAFLAKSVLMQSPIGKLLKNVPVPVWKVLAIAAAILGLVLLHQHVAHKAIADAKAEQKAADDAAFVRQLAQARAEALNWKGRAEQAGQAIAKLNKEKHDAETRSHAVAAQSLLVRGPRAAAGHCGPVDRTGPGAGSDRHDDAASNPDAAGSQMPAGNWALVPWDWLVSRALEHDDLLSEALTWRTNDREQREAREKLTSERSAPEKH